jgi:hypothetical protein
VHPILDPKSIIYALVPVADRHESLRVISIRPLPLLSIGRPRIWRNWAFPGATIALLSCGHGRRRWCWWSRELSGCEAGAPGGLRAWDFVVLGHRWRTCACRITVLTCVELDWMRTRLLDEAAPRLGSAPNEGAMYANSERMSLMIFSLGMTIM